MSNKYETELTEAEIERLAIVVEECAEVQQIAGKILRHGWGSYSPLDESKTSNRKLMENELGDLQFAISMLLGSGDVDRYEIARRSEDKQEKIKPYLHFQNNL